MAKKATTTTKKAAAPKKPTVAAKTVKKAAKKPSRPAESKVVKPTSEKMPLSQAVAMTTKRNIAILILLVVAIAAVLLYQNKGIFVAATVNGKPISRISVIKALEKQSGKTTLDSLITETLVMDEAQKQGKSVSQEEVDIEIKRIEESVKDLGQPLDELLALQGMTREQLVQQIKIQKMIEKLLQDKVSITDEEVSATLASAESNESLSASEEAKLKSDIKTNLTQQKIAETFPSWLEELKARSNIKYFTNY